MRLLPFLLVLFFVSCSSPRVVFDYDKKVDFTNYRSYNYYPDMETGMNQLDDKRLVRSMDSILQERGFSRVKDPDIYINIISEEYESQNPASIGIGLGSGGRNSGIGVSGGIPVGSVSLTQELVFDIIDVKRNELLWQATAKSKVSKTYTPLQREKYFRSIVEKVFNQFPPKN
ncbi:DUF4136 domain-containing protein [Ascidiimonas aurantiaca]|uniref:DUF4136 domain-containing protein n=1 Tax=Ascidiimonas aurantiaca TaxID=1685432 RepID=UPI0030EBD379